MFDKDQKITNMWFEPNTPNDQCFGVLDGKILKTYRFFSSNIQDPHDKNTEYIPVLYGSGEKDVTLRKLTLTNFNMTKDSQNIGYQYIDLFSGIHYKETDKIKNVDFEYPFIWGPYIHKKSADNLPSLTIKKTIHLDGSTKMHLRQTALKSGTWLEDKTTRIEWFRIESESGDTLKNIIEKVLMINYFLRLCFNQSIFPKYIKCNTIDSKEFEYYPHWLIWYHNNQLENFRLSYHEIMQYSDLEDNFESIMKKWIEFGIETYEIIFDFFYTFDSTVSIHTKFIEYAHILQRFYKSVNNHDKSSFREEIEWYLELCPSVIKNDISKDNFVENIVNTRNYNVHGNGNNEQYVIKDSKKLIYLTSKLKTLIEIFLIKQLPIANKVEIMKKINEFNSAYKFFDN